MKAFLYALPLALAACVEAQPPAEPPPAGQPACQADAFQGLVGQPRQVLRDMRLPEGSRIIGPTDPVTADFREDRLNFEIGKDGRIARIGCF